MEEKEIFIEETNLELLLAILNHHFKNLDNILENNEDYKNYDVKEKKKVREHFQEMILLSVLQSTLNKNEENKENE